MQVIRRIKVAIKNALHEDRLALYMQSMGYT
jgi:hypothetical protein